MARAKSFDTRIVFLIVVNHTANHAVLSNFLLNGGWLQIAKWLTIFSEKGQSAGIIEVLKCLQKLPVTLDTLKLSVNNPDEPDAAHVKLPGKMIKTLRKHEDKVIKELSTDIYKQWEALLPKKVDEKVMKKKMKEEKKVKKAKAAALRRE